jgi:DNA-directed RNA polymerase specialized sigma subunit
MNNSQYSTTTLQKQLDELRSLWNIHTAGMKAKEKANALIYFLDKHNILTQEDIGRVVGISKQRVGQIVQQINNRKGGEQA